MNPDKLRKSLAAFSADLRSPGVLGLVALLVVIAVAIPVLLSHPGRAATLSPLPPAATVTAPDATAVGVSQRKHTAPSYLTGPAHNPFTKPKSTTSSASTAATTAGTGETSGASTTPNGASTTANVAALTAATGGSGQTEASSSSSTVVPTKTVTVTVTAPAVTTTTAASVKPPAYSDYEVKVALHRTGTATAPLKLANLARYELLPVGNAAFAAFLGVRTDKKTAVFLLPQGMSVKGSGRCAPSASACDLLTLEPGESVTLQSSSSTGTLQTVRLSYLSVHKVTADGSVVSVDPGGRAFLRTAAASYAALKRISYGRFAGLLDIKLGTTTPVAS